jgi:hypothetical protein
MLGEGMWMVWMWCVLLELWENKGEEEGHLVLRRQSCVLTQRLEETMGAGLLLREHLGAACLTVLNGTSCP